MQGFFSGATLSSAGAEDDNEDMNEGGWGDNDDDIEIDEDGNIIEKQSPSDEDVCLLFSLIFCKKVRHVVYRNFCHSC